MTNTPDQELNELLNSLQEDLSRLHEFASNLHAIASTPPPLRSFQDHMDKMKSDIASIAGQITSFKKDRGERMK